jgi:hypothetical protein
MRLKDTPQAHALLRLMKSKQGGSNSTKSTASNSTSNHSNAAPKPSFKAEQPQEPPTFTKEEVRIKNINKYFSKTAASRYCPRKTTMRS